MEGKIAILIPTFNGKYVKATIESVLESLDECRSDEISAVYFADDASTDDTVKVAEQVWRGKIPLIVLRSELNRGEGRNVGRAVDQMKLDGVDWFMLVHHDDLVKPGWAPTLVRHIRSGDEKLGAISCAASELSEKDGEVVYVEQNPNRARSGDILHFGNLQGFSAFRDHIFWIMSGSAIRIQAYDDAGRSPAETRAAGDLIMPARMLLRGWNILELSSPLVTRRLHPMSSTNQIPRIYFVEGSLVLTELFDPVTERSRKMVRYARIFLSSAKLVFSNQTLALRKKSAQVAFRALQRIIGSFRKPVPYAELQKIKWFRDP
jgi:glycosyltransferase involved in cell wall biosynthesis